MRGNGLFNLSDGPEGADVMGFAYEDGTGIPGSRRTRKFCVLGAGATAPSSVTSYCTRTGAVA